MPDVRITKAGIYPAMTAAAYFADPCPAPALTQSLAKIVLERSPLHAWHAHPRLNPDFREDDDTKFDVGNIAHKVMIGRGKEIAVLEGFDDWRKDAAKEARAAAAKVGRLAVLGKHFAKADRMVRAAREQLELRGIGDLFNEHGDGECVLAWKEGDLWLRQMVDWLSHDRRTFCDFKTTELPAAPAKLPRMMINAGWPIQAAMAERGLDVLDPDNAGRRVFLFVVQETDPPYSLSVVQMSEAALTMGRKQLDMAVSIWGECVARDVFPGYPLDVQIPEVPGWHEQDVLAREIAHHERAPMLTSLAGG
jgi:hypothetical protein